MDSPCPSFSGCLGSSYLSFPPGNVPGNFLCPPLTHTGMFLPGHSSLHTKNRFPLLSFPLSLFRFWRFHHIPLHISLQIPLPLHPNTPLLYPFVHVRLCHLSLRLLYALFRSRAGSLSFFLLRTLPPFRLRALCLRLLHSLPRLHLYNPTLRFPHTLLRFRLCNLPLCLLHTLPRYGKCPPLRHSRHTVFPDTCFLTLRLLPLLRPENLPLLAFRFLAFHIFAFCIFAFRIFAFRIFAFRIFAFRTFAFRFFAFPFHAFRFFAFRIPAFRTLAFRIPAFRIPAFRSPAPPFPQRTLLRPWFLIFRFRRQGALRHAFPMASSTPIHPRSCPFPKGRGLDCWLLPTPYIYPVPVLLPVLYLLLRIQARLP